MEPDQSVCTFVFFCGQLDPNQDISTRELEAELGKDIRFYPLPCSGRLEAIQLLRSLEEGADRVIVITCPEGSCRYREGNLRARKRLAYAQGLIREIGLEPERIQLLVAEGAGPRKIPEILRRVIEGPWPLGPSPLRR